MGIWKRWAMTYCKLLAEAVSLLKGELAPEVQTVVFHKCQCFYTQDYIVGENYRIEIYKIASVESRKIGLTFMTRFKTGMAMF